MRLFYNALLWLLLPLVLLRLYLRGRKQPAYRQHIAERFGFYSQEQSQQAYIWIHAVSVGETRACVLLIQQLQTQYPEHTILISHSTPTGRDTSQALFGDQVVRVYLPYDYPFAVKRFLKQFRPSIGILMETEIWCNLIHYAHQADIPMLLLNGRMSAKSCAAYARFSGLTRTCLQQLRYIAAQTPEDQARFFQLGAEKVGVMGNLKYDITAPSSQLHLGKQFRQLWGNERPVLLAASTRDGEEKLILELFAQLNNHQLLLVIVPRHPQRFQEVQDLIQVQGFKMQTRSDAQAILVETQVLLGDSMGEMFAYYAAADLTIMGGSLLPFGSQNLIESCAVNTPVILGPYTYNFAQATDAACQAGAAIQVAHSNALVGTIQAFFMNAVQQEKMRLACQKFIEQNRGATQQALWIIEQTLH